MALGEIQYGTTGHDLKWNQSVEKRVSKDQPPCVEEQSGSKVGVLQR